MAAEKRRQREKLAAKRRHEKDEAEKRKKAQLKWNHDLAKAVEFNKIRLLKKGISYICNALL